MARGHRLPEQRHPGPEESHLAHLPAREGRRRAYAGLGLQERQHQGADCGRDGLSRLLSRQNSGRLKIGVEGLCGLVGLIVEQSILSVCGVVV